MTYGDVKLKTLTHVNKPCLRMTVQELKHTAWDNGNEGYSYVDRKFVGSVVLMLKDNGMLHGTHCNAARNTLQCYTEHTAMLHRTHCNVLISRDCNYRWCEPKPDAINLQPNPSEIFSWNIIVRAWAHLSQQTCCATYIQKFITLTGAHRLRVLNSRISRVSSVLYNELF